MSDDVRIIHGDCLDVIPTLDPASVAAIVTDPPYGTEVARDGYGRRQNYGGVGRAIEGDSDLSLMQQMLALAPRVLKRNAWLAVFCSPKRHAQAAAILEAAGFPIAGEVVWDKATPGLGGGIRYQHETILLCKHGKPTGLAPLFSVIRSFVPRENKAARHPHEKPVDVVRDLVRYCCPEGDVVLDPFVGSGTTLVACSKAGRKGIGIEIDERYIAIAQQRLKDAETPLFSRMLS